MPRTWFAQQPGSGSEESGTLWLPLRRADQQRLEAALLAAEVGLGEVPSVPVDGGRAEVKIGERLLLDRYGTVPPPPPRPLRRVLWLRGVGNGKAETCWQPYSEQADDLIEDAYHRLIGEARASMATMMPTSEFERSVNVPDSDAIVCLQLNLVVDASGEDPCPHWQMTAEEQLPASSSSWLGAARAAPRLPVKRGYGEVPLSDGEAEEEALGEEIGQLVVLLHSAGHEPSSSDLNTSVRAFRRNIHRRQLRAAELVENDGVWQSLNGDVVCMPPKIEVLEVSWEQGTQTGESKNELMTRLERLALPSMPRAREIANCVAAGALLYARHREEILAAALDAISAAVWRFEACHPNFAGDVMLVGHSLGGVALFDLLRGGRMSFQARSLFVLGSPVGLLLDASEDASPSSLAFPGGTRLFNVFHPLDPVAYRVEPLLAPEFGRKPAAKVPRSRRQDNEEDRGNLQNLQVFLGWSWNEEEEEGVGQQPGARGPELKLNGRVDWVLQDELSVDEAAGDAPEQALCSHVGYLKSADVAAFVHASAVALASSVENDVPPPEMPLVSLGEQLGQVISARWTESGAKANVSNAVDRVSMATRGVAQNVSKKFEQSGAADIVKGSTAAMFGVVGTARALYGTVRLVGTGVGAARDAVGAVGGAVGSVSNLAQQAMTSPRTSPKPSPKASPLTSPRYR